MWIALRQKEDIDKRGGAICVQMADVGCRLAVGLAVIMKCGVEGR